MKVSSKKSDVLEKCPRNVLEKIFQDKFEDIGNPAVK